MMRLWFLMALFVGVFSDLSKQIPEECLLPFPRSYVAYSLKEHEKIIVDGKLEEDAWKSVAWTEDFLGKGLVISNTRFLQICEIWWEGTGEIQGGIRHFLNIKSRDMVCKAFNLAWGRGVTAL